jgi:Uncharacterised protein family (UPF0236)
MTAVVIDEEVATVFAGALAQFVTVARTLLGKEPTAMSHAEIEDHVCGRGREILRCMIQDHLDRCATEEERLGDVRNAQGVAHGSVESDHERRLTTVVGAVTVRRRAYRHRGEANLYPVDAILNLPVEQHSHGMRRLAAVESTRGSFEGALEAIERTTGQAVGKRQVEVLAAHAAVDFDQFYEQRKPPAAAITDVLVISCDGKGIVMRPEALRPETARAAANAETKLQTRLSRGEKANRKRMAEVGAVYDITPAPRCPADIISGGNDEHKKVAAPVVSNKWLTASVVADAATVVTQLFDEAQRRDSRHERTWIALVDGNNHQIDRIRVEARRRNVPVTILIDFIHVLEYLWKAAWTFFNEGAPAAEQWVQEKALSVLSGGASRVAAAIRSTATKRGLARADRKNADICASYLIHKARYLDYPTALRSGWQIATGVIEGACRHLVKDRLDITGARWSLDGAEAVLKLRALVSNRDFDEYWDLHLAHERQRVHASRYAGRVIPLAA